MGLWGQRPAQRRKQLMNNEKDRQPNDLLVYSAYARTQPCMNARGRWEMQRSCKEGFELLKDETVKAT